ncbi:MAG TPA: hypothetical protein VHN58_08640, partial [Croceicoccus sp.]|nr:hypothetical protein [Croceicoccus sp.]
MKKGFLAAAAVLAFGSLGACATLEEEAIDATSDTYNANLTGAAVVGGGDADGSGMAEISISDAF